MSTCRLQIDREIRACAAELAALCAQASVGGDTVDVQAVKAVIANAKRHFGPMGDDDRTGWSDPVTFADLPVAKNLWDGLKLFVAKAAHLTFTPNANTFADQTQAMDTWRHLGYSMFGFTQFIESQAPSKVLEGVKPPMLTAARAVMTEVEKVHTAPPDAAALLRLFGVIETAMNTAVSAVEANVSNAFSSNDRDTGNAIKEYATCLIHVKDAFRNPPPRM